MRLTLSLCKRGWMTITKGIPKYTPDIAKFQRNGSLKWKDFQSYDLDPPYWYKWNTTSPYDPREQRKIKEGSSVAWYRANFHKMTIVPPDEWKIKVRDKVEILSGPDKGKQGTVIQVVPQGNIVLVGSLNCKYVTNYEITNRNEKPLQHHQVSLLDPKDNKPVEVEFRVNENGERVRVSKRSGHIIEWPGDILANGVEKEFYICGDKDTSYEAACERTYKASMDSWEEELKKIFKIKDPPRKKTYWY